MILSNTSLDILINGLRVDILDRASINLRINNVVYNPTEIKSVQAEYSFSFNLPTTPNNNKVFDYANELSKLNKFKNVYKCEVYADGILIFNGSLRILSIKKGFYNVNLVNIKINTVEDIFGEMKLNELDWKIPFSGANSINVYNADNSSKVTFPLVCYGAFLKEPKSYNLGLIVYGSKFELDKHNKWYYESFSPSPNLLETVKKLFELRGYKVQGNIFQDKVIPNLYMSTNLADGLIPDYNIGNPNLGKAHITCSFSNYFNKNTSLKRDALALEHDLGFPYVKVRNEFNIDKVNIYDLWSEENSLIGRDPSQYLFNDSSNCIVIPADGLYKIKLKANVSLPVQTLQGSTWVETTDRYGDAVRKTVDIENTLKRDMPVEIQLVRNTNECELIHGSYQWEVGLDGTLYEERTAYPHEKLYGARNPSVSNSEYSGDSNYRPSLNYNAKQSRGREFGDGSNHRPGGGIVRPGGGGMVRPGGGNSRFMGFMPKDGEFLAFDPWVNPNFIMGLSSMSGGTPSIIKNGYSWNPECSDKNGSRYNCKGYWSLSRDGRTPEDIKYTWEETEYNHNVLQDAPLNQGSISQRTYDGEVSGIVRLNRNDVVSLKAISRYWESPTGIDLRYLFDAVVDVTIEAYSPDNVESIDYRDRGWNSPTEFDIDLLIGNFFNKETKVADFISNFIKEFNLSFVNEGNIVYLNKQQLNLSEAKYSINLDDRIDESESSFIDYPNSMQVKYKINTEEWGFEKTVPQDHINDANWKDYGDYGSDKIIISDRNDEKEDSIQLSTSYTYYDDFRILGDDDVLKGIVHIPVISKFTYMINEYNYEESMRHDGKGLPLRYWFRGKRTEFVVNVNGKNPVTLYVPNNNLLGFDISYKNKPNTMLSNYFNINPNLSSNYLSVKCYLNSYEYLQLKKGANVIYDSDIYIVSEIQGYDVMGINLTELLLIKK